MAFDRQGSSENLKKAVLEDALRKLRWEWYQQRLEAIHQKVSAYDVLSSHGVELRSAGNREEQFACPFHGMDKDPSARIFPESSRGPSHAWCFVCQERWDVVKLTMKFSGATFTSAISELEKVYGLPKLEMPKELASVKLTQLDEDLIAFNQLYEVCESRLRMARAAYKELDDLPGFLVAGSVLDKMLYRVNNNLIAPDRAAVILRGLLEKVGAKVRATGA